MNYPLKLRKHFVHAEGEFAMEREIASTIPPFVGLEVQFADDDSEEIVGVTLDAETGVATCYLEWYPGDGDRSDEPFEVNRVAYEKIGFRVVEAF